MREPKRNFLVQKKLFNMVSTCCSLLSYLCSLAICLSLIVDSLVVPSSLAYFTFCSSYDGSLHINIFLPSFIHTCTGNKSIYELHCSNTHHLLLLLLLIVFFLILSLSPGVLFFLLAWKTSIITCLGKM